jgi:hypothetical protein
MTGINSVGKDYYGSIDISRDVTYTKKPNDKEGTSIGYNNGGMDEKLRTMINVLTKHYTEMNKINKNHSNPEKYIRDKYCNKHSSEFRSDMTEEERSIAYRNEMRMLKEGKTIGYAYNDHALRGYDGIYGGYVPETEKENQYSRDVLNRQIDQLLKNNNIRIPDNLNLQFSIDPYDFILKVSGSDDMELIKSIEELLNKGDNSKNLFYHIYQCMHGRDNELANSQLSNDTIKKSSVWWQIMNTTGYDLRKLRNENGTFYTDDGQDIIDIYKNSPLIPKEYLEGTLENYLPYLRQYSEEGFNNTPDLVLNIGYNSTGLYDIGQDNGYGYGQNGWLKELVSNTDSNISRFEASV